MERRILNDIEAWNKAEHRKPLILMGARQVGKTWLMDTFAQKHYPSDTVRVNLMQNERLRTLFESVNIDAKTVTEIISIETGKKITPGKSLVIIDEIQEAPRAITALKFLNEEMPDLAVMTAGSLLGLALSRKKRRCDAIGAAGASFPVGKVTFIDVPPMTFAEFLAAVGEETKAEALRARNWQIVNLFHGRFCELLKRYYFVGGMPEAVKTYAQGAGLSAVRVVQQEILRAYEEDFAKHASGVLVDRIRLLWGSIVSQLAKENKKFIYSVLRSGARAREYEQALEWLDDAGMAHIVRNVSKPMLPLTGYEDFGAFKLYAHDVGLVSAMAELEQQVILDGSSIFTHFKGALTEQYVAQELYASEMKPFYWAPDGIKAEVEFILQKGNEIYPIEVKAEQNLQAKSLGSYIKKFNPSKAIRLTMAERKSSKIIEDYPLYAVEAMLREI